jgi:hypothetical protein
MIGLIRDRVSPGHAPSDFMLGAQPPALKSRGGSGRLEGSAVLNEVVEYGLL